MARQIVKLLRKQHPDPSYVKKVFQYVREDLSLKGGTVQTQQLPDLLTRDELNRFYTAVWNGFNRTHVVMLKMLLFTGIRNAELVNLGLDDVDCVFRRFRPPIPRESARPFQAKRATHSDEGAHRFRRFRPGGSSDWIISLLL